MAFEDLFNTVERRGLDNNSKETMGLFRGWVEGRRQRCRMGGEMIGRHGDEGESKETAVLQLREDESERRPSWSFAS
jgi:hypothetical protein